MADVLYVGLQDDDKIVTFGIDAGATKLVPRAETPAVGAPSVFAPAFVYRHQWRPGDVLMWDNCMVQHRAIQDYEMPQRRLMHRTTMGGAIPA